MKNRDDSMEWIPLWVDKWIFGSTRIELQPDERAVWVDLMAIASKDNGFIRANPETPYPTQQLSGLLCITEELLTRSIQRCIATGKIKECGNPVENNSTGYYIINWAEYQLSDRHKRRFDENLTGEMISSDPSSEKILKEKIIKFLETSGKDFKAEKVCKAGRIDIFVNGIPPQIIEVKGSEYTDSIRVGIRQLLEYGIEFPGAILYLAVPNPKNLSNRLKEKLKEYRINLYLCPTEGHDDRQRDAMTDKGTLEDRIGEDRIGEDIKKSFPHLIVDKSKPQPLKVKCNLCGKPYAIKEEHKCSTN